MENQQAQSHGNNIDVLKKEEKKQEDIVMVDLDQSNDKSNNNGGRSTLIEELQRTRSHSSSFSDEEVEGGETKRKKKKGLKENIKENLSGGEEGDVIINHELQDTTTPQNIEEDNNHETSLGKVEATPEEDKKGFLEKINKKFNGHHKTESTTQAATIPGEHNTQHLEKKGILEKIKEKLPGNQNNDEYSDIIQKEKHS